MLNKLYRQMMFPELIPLFLIVPVFSFGSTEEFIKIPKTEETKAEGSCVTISCTYNEISDSNVKLLWFKDPIYDHKLKQFTGTILYSNTDDPQSPGYSSRVEYITDKAKETTRSKCDLKINDLQKTDSGNYSLRIIGSDIKYMSRVMLLTVTENPCNVSIEPSEMKTSVKENEEFSVRCSTSTSCPSYPEWFLQKPGQEPERLTLSSHRITQDKKISNLKFNPTWQDDNMTLFCRPANTQDSCLFRNISLSVEYGPKEVKATVSPGEIEEGDSVTLSCTSRGPNVTFSWFKQGIKKTQQSEWRLDNVKPDDSGDYYCKAENKHENVQSNKIYISVKYGPKDVKVTSIFNISNLKEGDELKLECSVGDSNPAPDQFYWYFNDSQLQEETSQILTISSVKPEHSGVYHCTAKNNIEAKQSENKVQVSVKYSPRQIKIEGDTSVKVNSKLTLACSADANPPPNSYNWKHTSTSQSIPLSFSKTDGVLTIDKVTIQHTGTYTCDVTNEIGTRSYSKNVTVLYPPSKPTLTMKSEVTEYEVIIITCTVQSSPKSHLTVTGPSDFRDMHQMNRTESENMLRISLNVTKADAGVYNCTATNSEGENQSKQQLKVLPRGKIEGTIQFCL